jgi:hypothetical protein
VPADDIPAELPMANGPLMHTRRMIEDKDTTEETVKEDKEEDPEIEKEEEEEQPSPEVNEDDQQEEEPPENVETSAPTPTPTLPATVFPTQSPVATADPTGSPTMGSSSVVTSTLEETPLPEITIDLTTDALTMDGCDSFFQDFVESLLVSSRVVTSNSLNSTNLQITVDLPTEENDETDEESSSSSSNVVVAASLNGLEFPTPLAVQIRINGIVYTIPSTKTTTTTIDLQEEMSHGMVVYLTLWGTGDLEEKLERCGFSSPEITAVHVNGTLVNVISEAEDENDSSAGSGEETVAVAATEFAGAVRTPSTYAMQCSLLIGTLLLFLLSQ